eukprot:COSAG02_NODE_45563_length_356_cov_0.599222_1_plen_89_part_01
MRLYSDDHAGLFVSNHRCELTEKLLSGMPHAMLLENSLRELYVLVPATACPQRQEIEGVLFPNTILLNRNDEDWVGNLGDVRHYLYRVH